MGPEGKELGTKNKKCETPAEGLEPTTDGFGDRCSAN